MSVRRFVFAFALVLGTVHCADHPAAVQSSFDPTPHFLRWPGRAAPQFTTPGLSASRAAPLSLDQYTVSFWAVRGQQRSARFNYRDALGETSHPFLILAITDPVALADSSFAQGDSVLVTVTIDTTKVGLTLEPSGLQFGESAYLALWYGGADGDLNGDGAIDETDSYIESELLGMWYREGADSEWEPIPAIHLLEEKFFLVQLPHFSEYAVSW
jgi:hypothetical protein